MGFIYMGDSPYGTRDFYSQLGNPTHIAKSVIYTTMTIVGDSLVTYRLYVVWERAWWALAWPVLFLFATAGLSLCGLTAETRPEIDEFYDSGRIWRLHRDCPCQRTERHLREEFAALDTFLLLDLALDQYSGNK